MALLFITSCKLSAANIAGEWFFTGVSSNVGSEMVTSAKRPEAYSTLKWLLPRVYSDVTSQLI